VNHPDYDALLGAIGEHPADDTPRLVFADWLDDHADAFPTPDAVRARAALIRDDVTLSRLDEYDPARLRWELIEKPRREREKWVREAIPSALLAPTAPGPFFRRGFPWCISFTPSQFLANAERFLPEVPAPTLSYSSRDSAAAALFRSPLFARVVGLHLRGTHLGTTEVQLLSESPHAAALEELSLAPGAMDGVAVRWLLRSGLFARLTRLTLGGRLPVGSIAVGDMRQAKRGRLRDLNLTDSGLTAVNVERLLTAPPLQGLERLSLAACRLGGASGYGALARAELPELRELNLSSTAPGPEGIRLFSTSPMLARLRRLGFASDHLNRALTAELAARAEVGNLRVLDLSSNWVGNDGATAIAHSPHFAGLLVLDLSYAQVGDEGVEAILESPLADGLVLLDLRGSPASGEMKDVLKTRMGDRVRL
jgi:uncharacterized protein (TIGR02996 family)